LVTVDWPGCRGYSVQIDLELAGYQATQHLLAHGHRRIGLVTFAMQPANVSPIHLGYQRALEETGLRVDPDLIAGVPGFDMASGAKGAVRLLALPQPPTAIFAIADTLALGALKAIKLAGLRIPEDIALAGFNDTPLAALVEPPLTTVAAPAVELGRQAMSMLQDLITGVKPSKRQIVLPTAPVIRRSCGCQPKP
jgi:DNA-binding LacI/PurR family transcriptional regulator